jgi:hypothetical protein
MAKSMSGLGFGRIAEQSANFRITFDVGAAREIQITAVRLRFTRERRLQIFMCLRAL